MGARQNQTLTTERRAELERRAAFEPHGPPYTGDTPSREIRADIDRTRRRMDATLSDLDDRLHPRRLLDDLIEMFRSRDGGAGRAKAMGRSLLEEAKNHPMPLALIGAGITWLIFSERGERERVELEPTYEEYDEGFARPLAGEEPPETASLGAAMPGRPAADLGVAPSFTEPAGGVPVVVGPESRGEPIEPRYGEYAEPGEPPQTGGRESAMSRASRKAGDVSRRAGEAGRRAGQGVRSAAHSVREAASRTAGRVGGGMRRARSKSGQWISEARGMAGGARERIDRTTDEYPIAMGLAALSVGVLAGLLLPRSRRENELMGEQADEFKRGVMERGEQLVERGTQVAERTMHRAREEAEREGIAPSQLAEKFRDVVLETKDTAKEAMKEKDLAPQQIADKARHVAEQAGQEVRQAGQEVRQSGQPPDPR